MPQTLIEKMMDTTNSFLKIWCFIFARVTSLIPLTKMVDFEG